MPITTKQSSALDASNGVSSATKSIAITPSDTDYLEANGKPLVTRGIIVGVAGDLTVQLVGNAHGTYLTFPALAGVIYSLQVERVRITGTDATGIYGLL